MKSPRALFQNLMPSLPLVAGLMLAAPRGLEAAPVTVTALRCEYLHAPETIDAPAPRLSWRLESERRGAAQTAWQIRVASTAEKLARGEADLWDSGRVAGTETNQVAYAGRALGSRAECFWQVQVWDELGESSGWSAMSHWAMGLLQPADWTASWIAQKDVEPLHTDRTKLYLPAARHYRKEFTPAKPVRRAVV